jgi:glycosyltransferase involved in cell wall biosynthesis
MATYNGERFIRRQLQTVLPQIGGDDELVLVDDASTDHTLGVVESFGDSRIRIFRNAENLGVDATFERALGLARGEGLFLCDQDDIWYPEKIERVMEVFYTNSDVTLVISDARIIGAEGEEISPSYFGVRGAFAPGVVANIIKSKFLGCAMAVRSCMRERFLPFPAKLPGHDMWIGVVNEVYGKTFFMNEPLIAYRRHGGNISPERRECINKMLTWRWQLIFGLTKCLVHQMFKKKVNESQRAP